MGCPRASTTSWPPWALPGTTPPAPSGPRYTPSPGGRTRRAGAWHAVAGAGAHPQVQGIVRHTRGESFVYSNLEELKAWNGPENPKKRMFVVAKTTFQATKWQEFSEFLKKAYTNAEIFDTIC